MNDYEYAILDRQESEADECKGCPYASVELCKNQCMETEEHYNPSLTNY